MLIYHCTFFASLLHCTVGLIGGNAGEQCNVPLVHFFRQPEWAATLHVWRAGRVNGRVIKRATQKMQCNWFLGSSASNLWILVE